jgi:hypothetical protein
MAHQEFLGELLAALKARREAARAEAGQAGRLERVDDAEHERSFGSDHGEADVLRTRERHEPGNVHGGDRDIPALRFRRRAGVARRDQDFADARRLRELPGERVLAAAAADDEDFHRILNAGNAACR